MVGGVWVPQDAERVEESQLSDPPVVDGWPNGVGEPSLPPSVSQWSAQDDLAGAGWDAHTLQQQLEAAFVRGWNACLAEIEKMNASRAADLREHLPMPPAPPGLHESAAALTNGQTMAGGYAPDADTGEQGDSLRKGQELLRMLQPQPMASSNVSSAVATESAAADQRRPSCTDASEDLSSALTDKDGSGTVSSASSDGGAPCDEPFGRNGRPAAPYSSTTANPSAASYDIRPVLDGAQSSAGLQTDSNHSSPAARRPSKAKYPASEMHQQTMERLVFIPLPQTNGGRGGYQGSGRGSYAPPTRKHPSFWNSHNPGHTTEQWLNSLPSLQSHAPLPELIDILAEAGSAGMELGVLARKLGSEHTRIDLLKLKGYLTCFPSRIVVAPKAKGVDKKNMVDQVWLIFDGSEQPRG